MDLGGPFTLQKVHVTEFGIGVAEVSSWNVNQGSV
jgi:hypothetical protein